MKTKSTLLACLFSLNIFAVNCPTANIEYDKIYNSLKSFAGLVSKNNTQCEPYDLAESINGLAMDMQQVDKLKFFLSSDTGIKFDSLEFVNQDGELITRRLEKFRINNVTRINEIQATTKIVQERVSKIIKSLTKTNCLEGSEKKSVLSTLAGVTQEISNFSVRYSGPYGLPIQVGGAAISGLIRAIDGAIKKSKLNYDFNTSEDRILFSRYLCIYQNVKEELDNTMYPRASLINFTRYDNSYTQKVNALLAKYPTAQAYRKQYDKNQVTLNIINSPDGLKAKLNTFKENPSNNAWTQCLNIASLVSNKKEELSSLDKEVGFKHNLFFNFVTPIKDCLNGKDASSLVSLNERSESVIVSYFDTVEGRLQSKLNNIIISGEEERLAREENNKIIGSPHTLDRANFSDWMQKSIERGDWIKGQKNRYKSLDSYDSSLIRGEITSIQTYLEDLIGNKLSGRFIKTLAKIKKTQAKTVKKHVKKNNKKLEKMGLTGATLADKVISAPNAGLSDREHHILLTDIADDINIWMSYKYAKNSLRRYCQYLYLSNYYYPKVQSICEQEHLTREHLLADGENLSLKENETFSFIDELRASSQEIKSDIENDIKILSQSIQCFGVSERLKSFLNNMSEHSFENEMLSSELSPEKKAQEFNNALQIIRAYQDKKALGLSSMDILSKYFNYREWAKKEGLLKQDDLSIVDDKIQASIIELRKGF